MKSLSRTSSRIKLIIGFVLILSAIIAIQVINFIGIQQMKKSQTMLIAEKIANHADSLFSDLTITVESAE